MAQYNGGTNWTRHTDYFLAENRYDTTGVSLATAGAVGSPGPGGTGGQGVTLISNRHVLMANHVSALWGTGGNNANYPITVYFVNNNNIGFTYTIDSAANVATIYSSNNVYTDISIGYLNTTVDSSLSFHKVIPSTFLNYIQKEYDQSSKRNEFVPYFPVFYMDGGDTNNGVIPNPYQKRTWCGNIVYGDVLAQIVRPIAGKRFNNSQSIVGGDSGNIVFIPFNQEIVVLGTIYQTDATGPVPPGSKVGISSFIAPHIDQINTAMTTLAGTSYSLTQADVSIYRTF
jgi:hypothetical protein